MKTLKELEKIVAETEEKIEKHRDELEKEIGDFQHAELEATKPKNSEKGQRHAHLHNFYQKRLEILKTVQKGLQDLETNVIEERKERLDEQHPRSSGDWDEEAKKSNRASLVLENTSKLVKGKEYDPKLGSLETEGNSTETIDAESRKEQEELEKIREMYVQSFLKASSLLNRKGNLEQISNIKADDLEQKRNMDQKIEEIRDDLKQRAEDINAMLLKASKNLKELEKESEK